MEPHEGSGSGGRVTALVGCGVLRLELGGVAGVGGRALRLEPDLNLGRWLGPTTGGRGGGGGWSCGEGAHQGQQ